MRFTTTAAASLAAAASAVSAQQIPTLADYSAEQIANGEAYADVTDFALNEVRWNITNTPNQECQFDDAVVRKEWRSMSQRDRKSFTDATTCLMNHEPLRVTTDELRAEYPGVRSRWDEYVAMHIEMVDTVHMTADFLAWHRYFIHIVESDLRNLCGYVSLMPYWNWALDAEAPDENPMFNGDEWSLGSNGEFIPDRDSIFLGAMGITLPPGSGGGCVHTGPFSDITVNLGPVNSPNGDNVENMQDYNPRCLNRDLNSFITQGYLTWTNLTTVLLENTSIEDFQENIQGYGNSGNPLGIHGAGHWALGAGSPMGDFRSSPGDPVFFLHHAMIDRTWSVWQALDIYRREGAIDGTKTLANDPPSPEMSLDDIIGFGLVAEEMRFGDLMSNYRGPFCYRYD